MPVWVGVALAALNGLLVLRDPRKGVLLYIALALLVPHSAIAGRAITYEILAFPGVVAGAFVAKRRLVSPTFHLLLLLYLILIALATLISVFRYDVDVEWVRAFGLIRFLVLLGLFREVLDREGIESVVFAVIGINAVVGLVQLLVPGSVETFFQLYGRESQIVLERYAERGAIPRALGTLESPANLGSLALLGLALGYSQILQGRSKLRLWTLIFFSGLAGTLSLTKTFFLGAPAVLVVGAVVRMILHRKTGWRLQLRSLVGKTTLVLVGTTAVVAVGVLLYQRDFAIIWYLEFIFDPARALETRYTSPAGTLHETLTVVGDNWFTGVGMTTIREEFLGDSTYIRLLHDGGVVAGLVFMLVVIFIAHRSLIYGRPLDLIVLTALLMTGIALPLLFTLTGGLFVIYLIVPPTEPRSSPAVAGTPGGM